MSKLSVLPAKGQMKDQATKGGILGIIIYLATKNDIDPEFVALCVPVISGILAYVSTKIGDKELASFFDR